MYIQLDLQYFNQEKTEQATPKKRKESREKGQVGKSTDVNTAFILMFVFLLFWFVGSFVIDQLTSIVQFTFEEYMLMEVTPANVWAMFVTYAYEAALTVAPIMLAAALAGIFANYIQVGFMFAPEAIKVKLEKVNPIKGIKRIFSVRALVEFLKSMMKITFVGGVTGIVLWFNMDELLRLGLYSVNESANMIGNLIVVMGLAVALLLVFLAMLDYTYQKYDHEKNIRMSKQDVKDEHKKTEGDPQIKSKIKEKQRQQAMSRMMEEVPKADVVITNPTHYAIALKYDPDQMDAPVIVAKGVDYVALKLINIAKNNEVVTVENRPLARSLYDQAEIGQLVPEDLFKAVAEVLAYVYRIQKKV
ncbi:flagellar biosynthesis protein FlhB [Salisediminibacterium halotolerans]|uniref:Flagellar biosynthetic protein FlhB n=1 Tax=Salisediminibacterium halotolerans TaxID=517425 RepID=A0A1H9Q7D4_9BACI|nr:MULTISPECIES: flagellar biosynthesis protein FlhB [Salisediminibacterium]RLJ74204.1 flagellar biosynthetic protein FlhB [Actinophytocola xinjiangensis]RPE87703.1 flagellar biosynthetic protein FlhB [Salisediminibacterium halotolerans]TWG35041.1 flagellar biosynthetic protein FlhB [Salisediminibacterium halotolerans]SER55743.1 flagellar biosynthetic protein FlhB [Salisediminibacterium haloalkalitolerans]GEL06672.1 flagellar biosynthetic protein FlhB [Salisediminibacterium halotolerans]